MPRALVVFLSLLASGFAFSTEATPQSQPCSDAGCDETRAKGGIDFESVTGTPGVNITVPLCNSSALPSNFEVRQWTSDWQNFPAACTGLACVSRYSHYPKKFVACEGNTGNACTDTMDWGDGNFVTNVHAALCDPVNQNTFLALAPDNAFHEIVGTMASVEGFVSNVTDTTIQGTITYDTRNVDIFHLEPSISLILQLQLLQGSNWVTVGSTNLSLCDVAKTPSCGRQGATLSATVPANSTVRMLLTLSRASVELRIYQMSLFGAECFPDAANPGMCIH